jgi:hypothetical protein
MKKKKREKREGGGSNNAGAQPLGVAPPRSKCVVDGATPDYDDALHTDPQGHNEQQKRKENKVAVAHCNGTFRSSRTGGDAWCTRQIEGDHQ